jgi:hypothetical protein
VTLIKVQLKKSPKERGQGDPTLHLNPVSKQAAGVALASLREVKRKSPLMKATSFWLTLADELRTASMDFDDYKLKDIKAILRFST